MSIAQLLDGNGVFLSNLGKPLSFGKLFFYDIGTTNLKTVYSDVARTIPATNPQILDISGRTASQIFMGDGGYTCEILQFNGTDALTAEDNEWSLDHQWDMYGTMASAVTSELLWVDTIAELRLVDQATNSFVGVRGYYEAGDMFARVYELKTSVDNDNGGTIIKNPLIGGTSWMYSVDNGIVDCRVFGIIPGLTTSYNSQFASLALWAYLNSIRSYIPKGVYYVTSGYIQFLGDLSMDAGVYFRNTGLTEFVIYCSGDLANNGTNTIKQSLSTANVRFEIPVGGTAKQVNPKWWGVIGNGIADDGTAFASCVNSVLVKSCTLLIDSVVNVLTLSSDLTISNAIRFEKYGRIQSELSTNNLIFKNIEIDNHRKDGKTLKFYYGCFDVDKLLNVQFINCNEICSSWFASYDDDGYTQNISTALNAISVTTGTRFIFDMPASVFNGEVAHSVSNAFSFVHESGILLNQGSSSVALSSLEANASTQVFSYVSNSPFIIANGTQNFRWFVSPNATQSNAQKATKLAMQSCIAGSGILDMNGMFGYVTGINQYIDVTEYGLGSYPRNVSIYNGTIITTADNLSAIDLRNTSFISFSLSKFNSSTSNLSGLLNMENVQASRLIIEDVTHSTTQASGCTAIEFDTGSDIDSMIIRNSSITSPLIASGLGDYVVSIEVENCDIVGSLYVNGCNANIHDNRFSYGSSGAHLLIDSESKNPVRDNRFTDYYCLATYNPLNSNYVAANFQNNTFVSSATQLSGIVINGNSSNSCVIIQQNAFTGSVATSQDVIQFSGTFANFVNNHILLIDGNNNVDSINLDLKQTEASSIMQLPSTPASQTTATIDIVAEGIISPPYPFNINEFVFEEYDNGTGMVQTTHVIAERPRELPASTTSFSVAFIYPKAALSYFLVSLKTCGSL